MRCARLVLLAALTACTWVTDADLDRRKPEVDDDGDGVTKASDCNDADPSIAPGVPEVWYNGIDNDCRQDDDYDQDGDGFVPTEYDGQATEGVAGTGAFPAGDCDDVAPRISPQQPDTFYDGVDQNCSGDDDYDQDGDGYVPAEYAGLPTQYVTGSGALASGDCNDDVPAINPDQNEVWYDGVDQDCDSADDYDQDGDGWVPDDVTYGPTEGVSGSGRLSVGDCDDEAVAIFPGATDAWYDGIDSDCRGDDDYDQDLDGVAVAGRGEDCDDEAPDVYPGARETLGDGVDSDCIGGDDAAKLEANSTATMNDVRAMRFVESDTRVYLALGAAQIQIVTPPATYYDSAVAFSWFRADLSDGYDSFLAWLPLTSDPAAFHLTTASFAVDTISGEDVLYGFFGLELTSGSGSRALRAYRYNVDRASVFGGPTLSVAGPRQPFDSVGMVLGADGRMHGVGCEATDGIVSWVRWTPGASSADFSEPTDGLERPYGACGLMLTAAGRPQIVAGDGVGTTTVTFDPGAAFLTLEDVSRTEAVMLTDVRVPVGFPEGMVVGVDGLTQNVVLLGGDGGVTFVSDAGNVVQADAWQGSDGTAYVAWVDNDGDAWLARKDVVASTYTVSALLTDFVAERVALHGDDTHVLISVAGGGRVAAEALGR